MLVGNIFAHVPLAVLSWREKPGTGMSMSRGTGDSWFTPAPSTEATIYPSSKTCFQFYYFFFCFNYNSDDVRKQNKAQKHAQTFILSKKSSFKGNASWNENPGR